MYERGFFVAAIFKWITVVFEFNKVTKMDSDVRVNLATVEDEYEKARSNVVEKEKCLEEARTKREGVLSQLDDVKKELDRLEAEESICNKKKMRAKELVQILDTKKESWFHKKCEVEEKHKTLIGALFINILQYVVEPGIFGIL